MDYKATPKWAWPGSRDLISKFRDPLITFERIQLSASNLVHTRDVHGNGIPSGTRNPMEIPWEWE